MASPSPARLRIRQHAGQLVLYPSQTRHWWPMVEDIMMSLQVEIMRKNLFATLEHNEELMSLSAAP